MYRKYACLSVVLLLALASGALGEVPGWWSLGINTTDGSATEQNGTITISTDGADIWGSSDQFHYAYQELNGDGWIVANVDSVQNTNGWAKAGVMMRQSTDPDSPHVMMALTGGEGGGATFQWRSSPGGECQSVDGPSPPIEPPVCVSIVRQGDRFSGWTEEPGGEWVLHGQVHVPMPDPVLVGLAVTSHAPSQLCTVTFDHVQLGGNITGRHVEGTVPGHPCVPVFTIVDTLRLDPLPPPVRVPNGRCTLHSDGWQCEVPDPPQDICSVQAFWLDINPAAMEHIFNEVLPPGEGPVGLTVYNSSFVAPPVELPSGLYFVLTVGHKGEIPLNDQKNFYTYAVVFDDGLASNNYVPWEDYPNDWYGGTDLWFELIYGPDSGWEFWATDVREDFAEVPSNAWATIADGGICWFIPLPELYTDTPTFRATAFCDTGDWGMFDPWSGDYVPLVDDPLLPVTGPVYTPFGSPEIRNIQFEQVNWYGPDGTLVEENSLWGRMLYEYDPGDQQTYYLNVNLANSPGGTGSWVVQNLPLFAVDNDDYSMCNEAVDINLEELGMEVGQDWSQAYCTWSLDDSIRTEPPTGPETLFSVEALDRFACGPTGTSPDPGPFTKPSVPVGIKLNKPAVKESKSRDVKAVQEDHNKCFAGSCARSLDWLNRAHGLGIGKGAQDIYDDLIAAGVSSADESMSLGDWIAAKNTYARQKTNNKIVTKVWDPGDLGYAGLPNGMVDPIEGVSETNGDFATWLKNELKHGEIVELAYLYPGSAHIVTVLRVYTSRGDTYVKYRDDEKQGPGPNKTKGDTHVKHWKVYKKDGKWHLGSDRNTIHFAVSESPDKNQNGIGDGFDAAAKEAMILDEFLRDARLAIDNQDGSFPVEDGMTIPGQMLGGELEVVLKLELDAVPGERMSAEIKSGSLSLAIRSTGQAILTWDGKGDPWDTVDTTAGLGGVDITKDGNQIGIEVAILNSSGPVDLAIVGFSTADDSSELKRTIEPTTSPTTVKFPFEDFVPNGNGADWTNIQAIVATLDMTGPADIEIDAIRTIPKPEALPEPFTEGFETGDFSGLPWQFGGDAEWFITSDQKNSGEYSAQAGPIGDDQRSGMQVTLDCAEGEISFYYKVSSESGYDFLRFYIDGTMVEEWSGETDWEKAAFPVEAGRRIFEWEYSTDSSTSEGENTGRIDDIVFPG